MRFILSLIWIGLVSRTSFTQEISKPNIVLLIADDLGLQCGCYGNRVIKTPNIDALAKKGTRFKNAFASVASCSPSRATLLTGLPTHQSGQYGLAHATHHQHTFAPVQSLSILLGKAGYGTTVISKLHVIPKEVYPWDAEINQGTGGGRDAFGIAQAAKKIMEDSKDKPFFLLVGFTDPHRAAKGFANKNYVNVPTVRYDPKEIPLTYHLPDQPEVREELAEYYQSISRLDHGVGLIVKALEETKKADNTLVIFLSDNGIPFPGAKTTLYDSGLHLPLIIHSPKQKKAGIVNEAMVSWTDIAPTILEAAGFPQPKSMNGRSLLPILDQENPQGWDRVFGSHQMHEITMYYPMRMVRTRTHKLILNIAYQLPYPFASDLYESPTWQGILKRKDPMLGKRTREQFEYRPKEELYDLTKDPNELTNLINDPKSAEILKDLREKLKTWQTNTSDPWLVKYRHE